MAVSAGADALGLVGAMPCGPGVIADEVIREISRFISPPLASFLLTSEQSSERIIDHVKRVGVNTVQIVDELNEGSYKDIRLALPHLKIVQVIHIQGEESIEKALSIEEELDAFLLDSGNPNAAQKILGGTGKTHDWRLSRKLVEQSSRPVFLAGGLYAGNVREAIERVMPFGVDICNGVRTSGTLDKMKLESFFCAVNKALG